MPLFSCPDEDIHLKMLQIKDSPVMVYSVTVTYCGIGAVLTDPDGCIETPQEPAGKRYHQLLYARFRSIRQVADLTIAASSVRA